MGRLSLLAASRQKTLKRINQLIKDIERNGALEGIGNPEVLKGDLQGEFSRRIDEKIVLYITSKMVEFILLHAVGITAINKIVTTYVIE